ncbi:hypothetical protein [Chryseobacterium lactis]|uniref:hypothetical protein n=1 Tax=Chryseobacterium lactis TaxID=1241981 RepID=UPI0016240294|nr:hypothetical protein [Chryseobacterium lactis]
MKKIYYFPGLISAAVITNLILVLWESKSSSTLYSYGAGTNGESQTRISLSMLRH